MTETSCAFCDFPDNDVVVTAEADVYSIISDRPINRHHVLVIPRQHYDNFVAIPEHVLHRIIVVAQRISAVLREVACIVYGRSSMRRRLGWVSWMPFSTALRLHSLP